LLRTSVCLRYGFVICPMKNSRNGLAVEYGYLLSKYPNLRTARKELMSARKVHLARLRELAASSRDFVPDYSPESLERLEVWYNTLLSGRRFRRIGVTKSEFQAMISTYFFQLVVNNHRDFRWTVTAYPFLAGRYEIGVTDGMFSLMGTGLLFGPSDKRAKAPRWIRQYSRFFPSKPRRAD
jgi:hypothetical protein